MKLKGLAVIVLLVLGCGAAFGQSGSFSLGFLSYTGGLQYCDYEVVNYGGNFAAGVHNLKTVCGFPLNAVQVGLKTVIPASATQPVSGTVFALADSTFDAQYIGVEGCQIDWVTKTTASTPGQIKAKHYGWSFYYSCGGGAPYLGNYGFLSSALGANSNPPVATFGKVAEQIKSKQ
jgi:hypothetical protein